MLTAYGEGIYASKKGEHVFKKGGICVKKGGYLYPCPNFIQCRIIPVILA